MRRGSLLCLLIILCFEPGVQSAGAGNVSSKAEQFLRAYPNFFSGYKDNTLLFHDGGGIQFDDGRSKTYEELLSNPAPADELSQSYPIGPQSYAPPAVNFDPGRYRCAALFKKMYGENPKEVESHLTTIPWLPHSAHTVVRITRVNGVDHQLEAVSAELDQLPPEDKRYVLKPGGTFNWRPIAGSDQLSAHSFGIAIDIDPDFSDYWRWNATGDHAKPILTRIGSRIGSSRSSSITALSGAANGITTTRCTLNIVPSFCCSRGQSKVLALESGQIGSGNGLATY